MPTCKRCGGPVHRGRCKQAQAKAPEPVAARADDGVLTVEPGHGFRTWIENDMVQVAQGETVQAYTRTEWRVLTAHHHPWLESA